MGGQQTKEKNRKTTIDITERGNLFKQLKGNSHRKSSSIQPIWYTYNPPLLKSGRQAKKLNKVSGELSSISSLDCISSNEGILIAVRDFNPTTSDIGTSISLIKGDELWFLNYNADSDWMEVQCKRNKERGWVPVSCAEWFQDVGSGGSRRKSLIPISSESTGADFPQSQLPCPSLVTQRWYHGAIHRSYAEYLLNSGITGSFLIRESETNVGKLTISLRSDGRIFHYRICTDENHQFYIAESSRFSTVAELVQHHEKLADGLACPLLYVVCKKDQRQGETPNSLETDNDRWEINRTDIVMKHKLGSGQYGVVYEAIFKPRDVTVAVKTLKQDITVRDEFLQEARLMKSLRHPNLVRLLGVCTQEPPYYIITEFMCNGNLLDYLRERPRDKLNPSVLLRMAIQVSRAMTYLEEHNFIHRDLAARNCLVGDSNIVKVADFGLARYMERDMTYHAREGAKFPIKWTAPEGLVYNIFSVKSDVWAFGVLLWEIATYGATPYPGVELQDVYVLLEKGTRMDAPQGCPEAVYALMLQCWSWDSNDRPMFRELCDSLEAIYNSSDISDAVEHQLQLHQIRMPPPPKRETISNPRRSSSCKYLVDAVVASEPQCIRREHAESFTGQDVGISSYGMMTGSDPPNRKSPFVPHAHRFSDTFCLLPPPFEDSPPPDLMALPEPHPMFQTAGSLGHSKKSAPVPPTRTTTLRGDEPTNSLQISIPDTSIVSSSASAFCRDVQIPIGSFSSVSPPVGDCSWQLTHSTTHHTQQTIPRQLPQHYLYSNSSPPVGEMPSLMSTSSTSQMSCKPMPTPPQRSESTQSTRSQLRGDDSSTALVSTGSSTDSLDAPTTKKKPSTGCTSPLRSLGKLINSSTNSPIKHVVVSPVVNPPVTPNRLPTDFQNELSSRLKRQLVKPRHAATTDSSKPSKDKENGPQFTFPQLRQTVVENVATDPSTTTSGGNFTAELIMESKSRLRKNSSGMVVQRREQLPQNDCVGKRMSWTPSSVSRLPPFMPPRGDVEAFQEESHLDVEDIMSRSVTTVCTNTTVAASPPPSLDYNGLCKQISDLCTDLDWAKKHLPNDHNSLLADRIEEMRHVCIAYIDQNDECSAHAKFKFRDECTKLQATAESLLSVGKTSAVVGRRKIFESVFSSVDGVRKSLLRLSPVQPNELESTSNNNNETASVTT